MPSYLDFDSTKKFRNYILGKTLTTPNGPQSFTSDTYSVQKTRDMSNVDAGDVETNRPKELIQSQNSNIFKPTEYFIKENIDTIPRRANLLLYPYFDTNKRHNFINIITGDDYSNESELMKFAAWNIKDNTQGPFFSRIRQNLYAATVGRVRLLDALNENTTTAINLITGREPLIEGNTKITVNKGVVGKGVDFLQTVIGVEFPWSEIPGDYLSNPKQSINIRPTATTEGRKVFQDVTGIVGNLIGIQRRPTVTKKPSDLFLDYMGDKQKSILFDNLSYSKYGPDYTTLARSQNTSKIFTFIDKIGSNVKDILGLDAPKKLSYIGDDRGNDVKNSMNDSNDRQVRGSYYLNLLFDEVQTKLFQRTKNISEGGGVGGKLTWISSKSKNTKQTNETITNTLTYDGERETTYRRSSKSIDDTLSTDFEFRENSILGITQDILETLPTEGGSSRSHVANVIDQTSRCFRDDDRMISRGSAVKYVNKFTGDESGVEYCRVWTKDKAYMNNSDTMKKTGTYRKFNSSVYTNAWNLNIYPNSNGNGQFDDNSTNMKRGMGDGFYAKKYMFSIENLAWKSSHTPGFTYNELPYCERGGNGGRIMWFPPYGLKVSEQNGASWKENNFLGRPEPVYTYQNTSRNGTIDFNVIVDHPSVLNLLVRKHFNNMSDEESDNYINAFFAGCEDMDFYEMIRKYVTLDESDVGKIRAYLNSNNKDSNRISTYTTTIRPRPIIPLPTNNPLIININRSLYYQNNYPLSQGSNKSVTNEKYGELFDKYVSYKTEYTQMVNRGLDTITETGWSNNQRTDFYGLTGQDKTIRPTDDEINKMKEWVNLKINEGFSGMTKNYNDFKTELENLKNKLNTNEILNDVTICMASRTSFVGDYFYNLELAYRRSNSVFKEIIYRIAKDDDKATSVINKTIWPTAPTSKKENTVSLPSISLKDLGYDNSNGLLKFETIENIGEQHVDCTDKLINDDLKKTAPQTFFCRETSVNIKYATQAVDNTVNNPPLNDISLNVNITNDPIKQPSPSINEMKKIVMKALSECYYFKTLEEDSPAQFSSLKEKLKYFHPGFHSMTPEGLNSRLTFLHQCIRPGDNIPIKGVSEDSDLNARNTTFGPPPICILRIGDFYHSKIAIKDVNISFDDGVWDLNPEGIGVQPMMAKVTLQIYFIGGQGLSKPVERLQNALSSNFYANTEMYDPRSISTETEIGDYDTDTFSRKFLEKLVETNNQNVNTTSQEPTSTEKKLNLDTYIGDVNANSTTISYKKLVTDLYNNVTDYYSSFTDSYNQIVKNHGLILSSAYLSPVYRKINNYIVQKGIGTQNIQLLGNYPKDGEFQVLINVFKSKLLDKIKNENLNVLFGFNKELTPGKLLNSEEILKPYIVKLINDVIDKMKISEINDVESKRNNVIISLDKLNFIIETGHDGKVDKNNIYTGITFSGYTYDLLYSKYSDVIEYINKCEPLFYEDLNTTSYVFSRDTTMTTQNLSDFLSELLKSKTKDILNLYESDKTLYPDSVVKKLGKRLDNFVAKRIENKNFNSVIVKQRPLHKNDGNIEFGILNEIYVFTNDEKLKLNKIQTTSQNNTTNTLNYYRGG